MVGLRFILYHIIYHILCHCSTNNWHNDGSLWGITALTPPSYAISAPLWVHKEPVCCANTVKKCNVTSTWGQSDRVVECKGRCRARCFNVFRYFEEIYKHKLSRDHINVNRKIWLYPLHNISNILAFILKSMKHSVFAVTSCIKPTLIIRNTWWWLKCHWIIDAYHICIYI